MAGVCETNIWSKPLSTVGSLLPYGYCNQVASGGVAKQTLVSLIINAITEPEILSTNCPAFAIGTQGTAAGCLVDADVQNSIATLLQVTANAVVTTATQATVGSTFIVVASATGVVPGQNVYAAGIPAGASGAACQRYHGLHQRSKHDHDAIRDDCRTLCDAGCVHRFDRVAVTILYQPSYSGGFGNSGAASFTVSVTLTAADWMTLCVGFAVPSPSSGDTYACTDNASNTYIAGPGVNNSANPWNIATFICKNVSGNRTIVTVTQTGGSSHSFNTIAVDCFSGVLFGRPS